MSAWMYVHEHVSPSHQPPAPKEGGRGKRDAHSKTVVAKNCSVLSIVFSISSFALVELPKKNNLEERNILYKLYN